MFICDKPNPSTGAPCNASFSRPYTLKRHDLNHHAYRSTTFVNCNPGVQHRRTIHPLPIPTAPRTPPASILASTESAHLISIASPLYPCSAISASTINTPSPPPSTNLSLAFDFLQGATTSAIESPIALQSQAFQGRRILDGVHDLLNSSDSPPSPAYYLSLDSADQANSRATTPGQVCIIQQARQAQEDLVETRERSIESEPGSEDSNCRVTKRKWSTIENGRCIEAIRNPPVPRYLVKRSKKFRSQQRGLDWLTGAAQRKFDETYKTLLALWGVKPTHKGTCVLCPEDWKFLDPIDLMALFTTDNCPSLKAARAWYSYSDHATTLARSKAWFSQWPRSGVELDNLLGSGPYKPMDASHLCHQGHCIIHVVYEGADTNQDRESCRKEARFLRQDGRPVPESCAVHNPPCMMQHAALSTTEAYYIQFATLRRAKGLPPTQPTPRPRRHVNPTLESQLPSLFSAITTDADELVPEALPIRKEGRPELVCKFCTSYRIKAFASITGLWAHVANKHPEVDDGARLREVQRTALLWQAYWDDYSDGGKRGNPTVIKLKETQGDGFGWDDVLRWGLRGS